MAPSPRADGLLRGGRSPRSIAVAARRKGQGADAFPMGQQRRVRLQLRVACKSVMLCRLYTGVLRLLYCSARCRLSALNFAGPALPERHGVPAEDCVCMFAQIFAGLFCLTVRLCSTRPDQSVASRQAFPRHYQLLQLVAAVSSTVQHSGQLTALARSRVDRWCGCSLHERARTRTCDRVG